MSGEHVRDPELGGPGVLGNREISTAARVAALDCALDVIGSKLSARHTDMVIDYAASRFERGEVQGALNSLTMITDDLGALRLAAVMHTKGES